MVDISLSYTDTLAPTSYDQFTKIMAHLRRTLDEHDPSYANIFNRLKTEWDKSHSSCVPLALREPLNPGGAILITGPRCSGKTTLAHDLVNCWSCKALPDRVLYYNEKQHPVPYGQLPNSSELNDDTIETFMNPLDEVNAEKIARMAETTVNYNIIIVDESPSICNSKNFEVMVYRARWRKTILILISQKESDFRMSIRNNCDYRVHMS